jgi:5'(3')-deoxyribonucleotidase
MLNLDMDGVLVDLLAGLHRSRSRRPLIVKPGTYDFSEILGWNPQWDKYSATWWANLPRTEWASDLVEAIIERYMPSEVRILTKYVSPACAAGKLVWIKANYPRIAEQIVLVSHDKDFACQKNDILIDDYEGNTVPWSKKGGYSILVPQPWNSLHGNDVMQHIERELDAIRDTEHG